MSHHDPGRHETSPVASGAATDPFPHPPVRWHRRPGWVHRILDDEVLLLGPERELMTLTGLASPVWLVLDRPGSTFEVTGRINGRWPTRPTDDEAVDDAVSVLVDRGVVAEHEPGVARVWGVADGGSRVEVAVARSLLPELARRWPLLGLRPTLVPPDDPAAVAARLGLGRGALFVPDDLAGLDEQPEEAAWGLLEQSLTAIAVAELEHLVPVHAAVVAHGGAALLLPAASGSGKSTLTAAAARAGATVLSDEYALVDPDSGLVTGWPRPIRLRRPDGTEERVDLARSTHPVPVGVVASLAFQPGAGNDWTPVSASEAVLDLLANTIVARTRPDAAFDAALAVTRHAHAVKGVRGDADAAVTALLALLDRRPPAAAGPDTT